MRRLSILKITSKGMQNQVTRTGLIKKFIEKVNPVSVTFYRDRNTGCLIDINEVRKMDLLGKSSRYSMISHTGLAFKFLYSNVTGISLCTSTNMYKLGNVTVPNVIGDGKILFINRLILVQNSMFKLHFKVDTNPLAFHSPFLNSGNDPSEIFRSMLKSFAGAYSESEVYTLAYGGFIKPKIVPKVISNVFISDEQDIVTPVGMTLHRLNTDNTINGEDKQGILEDIKIIVPLLNEISNGTAVDEIVDAYGKIMLDKPLDIFN